MESYFKGGSAGHRGMARDGRVWMQQQLKPGRTVQFWPTQRSTPAGANTLTDLGRLLTHIEAEPGRLRWRAAGTGLARGFQCREPWPGLIHWQKEYQIARVWLKN